MKIETPNGSKFEVRTKKEGKNVHFIVEEKRGNHSGLTWEGTEIRLSVHPDDENHLIFLLLDKKGEMTRGLLVIKRNI